MSTNPRDLDAELKRILATSTVRAIPTDVEKAAHIAKTFNMPSNYLAKNLKVSKSSLLRRLHRPSDFGFKRGKNPLLTPAEDKKLVDTISARAQTPDAMTREEIVTEVRIFCT
jgi:hypothetical protein